MAVARPTFQTRESVLCAHCGQECLQTVIGPGEKTFCCEGCRWVYTLLADHGMESFYDRSVKRPDPPRRARFESLDIPELARRYVIYSDDHLTRVVLKLPQIHCTACIWLLENLGRLEPRILDSRVHFINRTATITFRPSDISLRDIAEFLSAIGYEPDLHLDGGKTTSDRSLTIRLGVAGFSFANLMLLALPDYLSQGGMERDLAAFFKWISFFFLPLIAYAAIEFVQPAWLALRRRRITMDVPLTAAILSLFARSTVDLLTTQGTSYLDSLAGLVFFLLLGKVFQKKTFHALSFQRHMSSYLPIAVTRQRGEREETVAVETIAPGDVLIIRHGDLIPVDSTLLDGDALIDYSFLTGESDPVVRQSGDLLYAGGRQMAGAIRVACVRTSGESYLAEVWQPKRERLTHHLQTWSDRAAEFLTAAILVLALAAAITSWVQTGSVSFHRMTAILIVACGCGLPLSIPFTLGTALRVMAGGGLYLRNADVVERMAHVDSLVFDKTGTLTSPDDADVTYHGQPLSNSEALAVISLLHQSSHPMSRRLARYFGPARTQPVSNFIEHPGRGIQGTIGGYFVRLGSRAWLMPEDESVIPTASTVFLEIDGRLKGSYALRSAYRDGVSETVRRLSGIPMAVLSGDHDGERPRLESIFGKQTDIRFHQLPDDKRVFIESWQSDGRRVLMLGDGINDAAALEQADVGLAVAERTTAFTPGCDGILQGHALRRLPDFLEYARKSRTTLFSAFALTIVYNLIAIAYAWQGQLTPVVAAILMPMSSITVVAWTVGWTWWKGRGLRT